MSEESTPEEPPDGRPWYRHQVGRGVTNPRTIGGAKARDLDLEGLQLIDPAAYDEKIESRSDDHAIHPGGLQILGSSRHESRRIDRQLRGRAGRQGDPGFSQFFSSVEDDLMRLFVGDRLANAMDRLGAQEGEVITHSLVTRSIETTQKRVEGNNAESRKQLRLAPVLARGWGRSQGRDLGQDRAQCR